MENKIIALSKLGREIEETVSSDDFGTNDLGRKISDKIGEAYHENGWFTKEAVLMSLHGISSWLNEDTLQQWKKLYEISPERKKVGLIMAGNIPLVGFHDLLCVLLSENTAQIKMSSSDKSLLPGILERLVEIEPEFKDQINFVQKLSDYDAVIATGSNNSARYFEYYFRNKPHIIRKNRNSIAVLKGDETEEELRELGKDIFSYYGLGCRNVSKILIPEDFDLDRLFGAILDFNEVAMNKKYANNYDYYKALYLLNKADLIENGFLLVKEDSTLHSPVSMLFYQRYQNENDIKEYIEIEKENIQCVVSKSEVIENAVPFGKSQFPSVDDYADGVDTMKFLTSL